MPIRVMEFGGCAEDKYRNFHPRLLHGDPMLKTSDVLLVEDTTQKMVSPIPGPVGNWYLDLRKNLRRSRYAGSGVAESGLCSPANNDEPTPPAEGHCG